MMDLAHLVKIGLQVSDCTNKAISSKPKVDSSNAKFEAQFPALKSCPGYLQKIFNMPTRPPHIVDMWAFIDFLEERFAKWPNLKELKGGPEVPLSALRVAVHKSQGDVSLLDAVVRDAHSELRTAIVDSDLCASLMCQTDLWNLSKVRDIFNADVPLPAPEIGRSCYGKMNWIEKYDGAAFLSIDMKEANLSALKIMARLVDAKLYNRICCGWDSLLEDVLGAKADVVRGSKKFRQVVLGTLEREWLRGQEEIGSVVDETMLQNISGATLVAVATAHEPDRLGLAQNEVTACQKAYKKLSNMISRAYEAVERLVVQQVASVVASRVNDIKVFAIIGDEVVFKLPPALSATEADRILDEVSKAVEVAFCDEYRDLADLFRLEIFKPVNLGCPLKGDEHWGQWAFAAPTRRFHREAPCQTFVKVKGVPHDMSDAGLETLSGLLDSKRSSWASWLRTETDSRNGGA